MDHRQDKQGRDLDVICIGRASVDLYGEQIGGRLEDMASFAKYAGGSPTNIAIGAARLGLRSALITRVGNEHFGRFIRETLEREAVDVTGVKTDPKRLTALAILGIRNQTSFPLIFYRENCADMALDTHDIDPAFIKRAQAILVTGTHFSTKRTAAMNRHAIAIARKAGCKIIFDLDYRPNLWALGGHGDGEERFRPSHHATRQIQTILPDCDLIIGTEEEWCLAGGQDDALQSLQKARMLSDALFVCKQGAIGCTVFPGPVTDFQSAIAAPGLAVEVFNVLGAGDGFMAGFLRGWLRGEPLEICAEWANGCGALAVSRHGCAPAYPSFKELRYLLDSSRAKPKPQTQPRALRHDTNLARLHRFTTEIQTRPELMIFAFDHRIQLHDLAQTYGCDTQKLAQFKQLALQAAASLAKTHSGRIGVLIDDEIGWDALSLASDHDLWCARPIERPGAFPLELKTHDISTSLRSWPANHVVKVLAPLSLDDSKAVQDHHAAILRKLVDACHATGHALLLEIITERDEKPAKPDQVPELMKQLYEHGIHPDWWKLEPSEDPGFWKACGAVVQGASPNMQGILVLGSQASQTRLAAAFRAACQEPMVHGFAIGRAIFSEAAQGWLSGSMSCQDAVQNMAHRFANLIEEWSNAA